MKPEIIEESDEYLVLNKPAGWAVESVGEYPAVVDWLVKETGDTDIEPVHRLDVETSGVLIVAKNKEAKERLQRLWQGRVVKKIYLSLVVGETPKAGVVELPIARDTKKDRMKASLLPTNKDKPAITRYRRLMVGEWRERAKNQKSKARNLVSLLELSPITGRTHQIRVHLKSIGYPIVGDKLYGERSSDVLADRLGLKRQFLHAWKITIDKRCFTAPLPAELVAVLAKVGLSSP